MKKITILLTCSTLAFSSNVLAFDWLDTLKSAFGLGEEKTQTTVKKEATAKRRSKIEFKKRKHLNIYSL